MYQERSDDSTYPIPPEDAIEELKAASSEEYELDRVERQKWQVLSFNLRMDQRRKEEQTVLDHYTQLFKVWKPAEEEVSCSSNH